MSGDVISVCDLLLLICGENIDCVCIVIDFQVMFKDVCEVFEKSFIELCFKVNGGNVL